MIFVFDQRVLNDISYKICHRAELEQKCEQNNASAKTKFLSQIFSRQTNKGCACWVSQEKDWGERNGFILVSSWPIN